MTSTKLISSSRFAISFLGGFALYIDGNKLPDSAIEGRKARTLLKLLAHQRHFQMVREQVAEILWPDLDIESANAQIYKAIHYIRKAFGQYSEDAADWIVINDDLIRLDPPDELITDLKIFESSARDGIKTKNIKTLEHALSLYKGNFLPVEQYTSWASFPREHYLQLYLDVLTALSVAYEQQGNLSDAAEIMRIALDKEPTLETAHRGLMRIYAKKGQATRAFHQYDLCRDILRERLGISPTSETKSTLEDVWEGKLLENEKKQEHRKTGYGQAKPMVGRSEECATINQELEKLTNGKGGSLILAGEPGMGKSLLVQKINQKALQNGLAFYSGRSGSGVKTMPFGIFIELFKEILNENSEMANQLPSEFGHLIPGFSGKKHPLPHGDKLAAKGYLFAEIHQFFKMLSSIRPTVIVLEDINDADLESRDLLFYLLKHSDGLPILFVITLRKEKNSAWPGFIGDMKDVLSEIIELDSLSFEEHMSLLQMHAENAIIGADVVSHIYQLTEGNPFYSLELLRHYAAHNYSLPAKQNQSTISKPNPPVPENLPASVFQMVEEKLEVLSPPARHLLYIAAVIGRQVPYELLASIWNAGDESENLLFNALEEVIRGRLLEEHGLDYTFRHALVQETIYSSVSEARRQILHRQIANKYLEISEETGRDAPAELIAWHFLGAKDIYEAAKFLIKAGRRAEKIYAHEDALQRYREAYDVLESIETVQAILLKCETLERIGDVYRSCGQIEKSYGAYQQAIDLAEDQDLDRQHLSELHRKMAVAAILRTEIDRSEKHLEKAFQLADGHPGLQARLLITRALHFWHLNRLDEAYDLAKKALEQATMADSNAEISQACEILAMTCLPLGRWEEGLHYEMRRKIHGWSPEIVVATDAHLCLWEYHVSGDQPLQQARIFMERVSERATEIGDLRCVAVCHYAMGTMHLWRGNRRHAVEALSSSLELHKLVGSPAGMAYSLARKSVLHTLMGAQTLGWQAIQDGLTYAGQASVRDHCLQRLYGVGIWNRLECGDLEEASRLVKESEALLASSGACGACALELYPWLAYYFLQTNQIDKARACGKAVNALVAQTGNPIGKAISAMISSNLSTADKNRPQAEKYSRESYNILKEAIPETAHSPIAHFLNLMTAQQAELA